MALSSRSRDDLTDAQRPLFRRPDAKAVDRPRTGRSVLRKQSFAGDLGAPAHSSREPAPRLRLGVSPPQLKPVEAPLRQLSHARPKGRPRSSSQKKAGQEPASPRHPASRLLCEDLTQVSKKDEALLRTRPEVGAMNGYWLGAAKLASPEHVILLQRLQLLPPA